ARGCLGSADGLTVNLSTMSHPYLSKHSNRAYSKLPSALHLMEVHVGSNLMYFLPTNSVTYQGKSS
ncbi:MAG: hypothetical protein AAF708_03740, partial [Deinococcota bacterium]